MGPPPCQKFFPFPVKTFPRLFRGKTLGNFGNYRSKRLKCREVSVFQFFRRFSRRLNVIDRGEDKYSISHKEHI